MIVFQTILLPCLSSPLHVPGVGGLLSHRAMTGGKGEYEAEGLESITVKSSL